MSDQEQTFAIPGKKLSYWLDTSQQTSYPTLEDNITADVVVVGGGIAGITTAYLLQRAGKNVVLLEAETIARGVTGHTTAKLTSLHTLIYDYLINRFGQEKAQQYADAQQTAIEFVAQTVHDLKIECDFNRASAYTYVENSEDLESIHKEIEAANRLDLPARFTTETELPFPIAGAVKFHDQALFHPRNYLLGLVKRFSEIGGQVYEHSRVLEFSDTEPVKATTAQGSVTASKMVLATHFPLLNKGAFYTRLEPYRSYVYGVYVEETVSEGMYISATEPLFSVRPQHTAKGTMLIVTGVHHKTGNEPDTIACYQQLENLLRNHFTVKEIAYHWSTQDNDTIDRVPYIGQAYPGNKDLYVATGFGGWGMSNGIASGMILKDLVLGVKNPWKEIFDPSRAEQVKEAKEFLKQNLDVAKQLLKGKLTLPEIKELSSMTPGTASVIQVKDKKVAIYKDKSGEIHAVSTTCTHLGCEVNFNNAEVSWDCPCHGSRFSVEGKVLHGPATKPLQQFEVKKT